MRQVTIFTSDNEYENFLDLAKSLSYVKKIVTDEKDEKISFEDWTPSQDLKNILDKALKQDKDTFISRDVLTKKYDL